MRSLIAVLGAVLTLAFSAAPALSMPAHDSLSDTVVRQKAVSEPVIPAPIGDGSGTGASVVIVIGAAALLTGAGLGFGAARASRRPRGATAG